MKNFKKICRKDQMELKAWLEKLLKAKYKEVINGDGFLYAKGKVPILLTAHMDTVHKETCRNIYVENRQGKTVLSSPQGIGGDDRCGVWMIYMILTRTKYRPSILFCEDEEIGGVGSDKFVKAKYKGDFLVDDLQELKYLIELDRANDKDAVYYDCGNAEFMKYIEDTIGYTEAYGSFSDISHLSPACDVASVNLSCGYYKAHTLQEYVVFDEMYATYKAVKKLLSKANECEKFDYKEVTYYSNNYFNYGYDYYGTRDSYMYGRTSTYGLKKNVYEFIFKDEDGNEDNDIVEAKTIEEAMGMFFYNNPTTCFNDLIDYYVVSDFEEVI